jgi:hypothetical protein
MMRAALALAALLTVVAPPVARDFAFAGHETRYRYVVLGFVKDAQGQPRRGAPVELVRDRTGLSYKGETDEQGLYVVVARLGDETLGESLTLRIGEARLRLTVSFEPDNHRDERGTRVDLEGARWAERSAWFRSTLERFLAPTTH